jgi:protein involved in polysaccharide export with SLBB domain
MIAAFVAIFPIRAQEDVRAPDTQTQLAISSPSYPVTAGDVYSLTYSMGVGLAPVSYPIIVDYSYRIRVSNMAVLNVAGKTYRQLKQDVEAVVSRNYPLSGAQLVMVSPGTFTVYIKGEVIRAAERSTWAMGRLSALLAGSLSAYSSTRDIMVTSPDGQENTYDLFKARRFGDLSQDPYLRPGDIITVKHLDRKVTIHGEVEQPGSYELLSGENIQELIRNYANNYTARANTGRVGLRRYEEGGLGLGNIIYLTREEINANHPLRNFDVIYVLSK